MSSCDNSIGISALKFFQSDGLTVFLKQGDHFQISFFPALPDGCKPLVKRWILPVNAVAENMNFMLWSITGNFDSRDKADTGIHNPWVAFPGGTKKLLHNKVAGELRYISKAQCYSTL